IVSAFDSAAIDKTFFHGHSYTANPIACAAANASYELLTNPACQESIHMISSRHAQFARSLKGNSKVHDARTLGTILAVELTSQGESAYENELRKKIYPWFMERDILLRPLGNVIYMLPPYVISEEELSYVYRAIEEFI